MVHIHLIYAHNPDFNSTPHAIGYELTTRLRQARYTVSNYDWDELITIKPENDAILIGHAHPLPLTIFRNSMKQAGWRRIILLEPYAHGNAGQVAFLENVIRYCDIFLAITGRYWFENITHSDFSHWKPRIQQIDLAVNRANFESIKSNFNLANKRRFIYIGNATAPKNIPYLNQIAESLPHMEFAWVGKGKSQYNALNQLGFMNFKEQKSLNTLHDYDFMITVGNSDANPTTILEAMAWGLIPVCTPQSGYEGYDSIINLPLNDIEGAKDVLEHLQTIDHQTLENWQKMNWALLDTHFNWDRFAQQVIEAIQTDEIYPLASLKWWERFQIGMIELKTHFDITMIRQDMRHLLRLIGLKR